MQSNTTAAPTASTTPVSFDKLNWGPVFDDAAFWKKDLRKTELNKRLATQMNIRGRAWKEWQVVYERLWHTRTIAKLLASSTERRDYTWTLRQKFNLERRESTGEYWDDPLRSWIYREAAAVRVWCYLRGKNPNRLYGRLGIMLHQELGEKCGRHSGLKRIYCESAFGGHSYYVGTISVWHKGVESLIPDQVFIKKRKPWSDQNKVLLYDSGIGTGKTIELAASAFSRDAPIAFLLEADGDIKESVDIQERHTLARNKLKASLDACVVYSKQVINTISRSVAFWNHEPDDKDDVTVILGIDNASKCPNLVQAIIHQYRVFGDVLGAYIMNECEGELPNDGVKSNLKVAFSIAGAGVHNFAIGSISYHYECHTPTVLAVEKQLYGYLRQKYPKEGGERARIPEYDEVAKHPLFGPMATNPRMQSILLDFLSDRFFLFKNQRDHETIVWNVLQKFMGCGSMKELRKDPETLIQMASQTLATLLFQREFTMTGHVDEIVRVVTSLDYGIQFATFEKNTIPMRRLVEDSGLVTPVRFPSSEIMWGLGPDPNKEYTIQVPQPFQVDKAMELLCIWLVQRGKTWDHPRTRFDIQPLAFEALAPQLISCAIGGAMTVAQEVRKDVKSILMDTLNMYVSPTSIDHADSEGEELWDGLRGVIPVSAVSDLAMKSTHFHRCPMRISRADEDDSDGYESESNVEDAEHQPPRYLISPGEATTCTNMEDLQVEDDSDRRSGDTLVIDKEVVGSLLSLRAACSNIPSISFCSPLTTVVQEDSDLMDGSVSFVGGKRDANGQLKDLQVYTICTIAKNSFCARDENLPEIYVKKLRMAENALDLPFGKNRWYCVMSRKETCPAEQPIHGPDEPLLVSFPVDRSPMLSEYMTMLDDTWNPHARHDKYGTTITMADLNRWMD